MLHGLVIASDSVVLTKVLLFLQHFLGVNINVNIFKIAALTLLFVSVHAAVYCVNSILFVIVLGFSARCGYKGYLKYFDGNKDFTYMGLKVAGAEQVSPYIETIKEANATLIEQIEAPHLEAAFNSSVELSNVSTNYGW
jgi:hypothetical protein